MRQRYTEFPIGSIRAFPFIYKFLDGEKNSLITARSISHWSTARAETDLERFPISLGLGVSPGLSRSRDAARLASASVPAARVYLIFLRDFSAEIRDGDGGDGGDAGAYCYVNRYDPHTPPRYLCHFRDFPGSIRLKRYAREYLTPRE